MGLAEQIQMQVEPHIYVCCYGVVVLWCGAVVVVYFLIHRMPTVGISVTDSYTSLRFLKI